MAEKGNEKKFKSPDYLIDKRTLNKKDLKISDDNYVFALRYPDCLIGAPYAFDGGRQGDPVIYDIESGAVLGSLKNGNTIVSAIFAWDPKNSFVFYRSKGKAKGETTNWGKVLIGGCQEEFSATLEFIDNSLQLQVSEDKHAIYPTAKCDNNADLFVGGFGEDCGGGGVHSFVPCNAGEPGAPLMDNIGYIFPNERIWSGNTYYPGNFCGGLQYDGSPSTIGNTLNDTAMLEDVLYKDIYGIHHNYQ